jgi:hypothetical protein
MYDPLSFMSHLATGTCKAHTPATMNPQTNADVVSTFQTAVYTIGLREPGTVPGFQVWGQKFVLLSPPPSRPYPRRSPRICTNLVGRPGQWRI